MNILDLLSDDVKILNEEVEGKINSALNFNGYFWYKDEYNKKDDKIEGYISEINKIAENLKEKVFNKKEEITWGELKKLMNLKEEAERYIKNIRNNKK
ncbi:hypothetical protein K9L04_00800 [Patescibacteria group bacterium]|nr:hypothetical protein [Patescibacteria group bacterium]